MHRATASNFWWAMVVMAGLLSCVFVAVPLQAQGQSQPHVDSVHPDPITGSIDWKDLAIRGRGFEKGFAVRLHAEDVVDTVIEADDRLTYVDAQTVRVRAVFGTAASEWEVQVINPDSVASNAYAFNVEAPPPQVDVVRPLRRSQDGDAFKVTIQGSTLTPYSTVRWNGQDLPTTPIKSSPKSNAITIGLEATVPPSAVEGPGENAITVHTPPPGGGTSSPAFFTVTAQPFYQTTWFYLGVVGLIILSGLGLHWLRVRHVRERELERKVEQRTEALREEKEKTERQAERLEALDEARSRLFQDLSHELRTPLTMISTPLHTVLVEAADILSEEKQEMLAVALRNTERLETLVDQVLKLSRLETGRLSPEPQPGDLVAFAHETTRSFEPMAEREDLRLRFRAGSEQLPSVFDPEKLRSVLGNLIKNALHYTPDGGKVMVRVERLDAETAALRVSDTGPGIPEDERSDLFERFYRGEDAQRRRSDGAGLGLTLAKELAELHDGTIEVESEPGMGSTFTALLPIREPEPGQVDGTGEAHSETDRSETPVAPGANDEQDREIAPSGSEVPADAGNRSGSTGSSPTLLVVEDNADVRTYLRNQLSGAYAIQEAECGAEALNKARAESPDLILSDVMMPDVDGLEMCRRLKDDDALRDVPVLLLTAKAGEEAEVEGLDAGADAYVEKPFSMDTLRARIQSLLDNRAALRDQYRDEVVMRPSDVSVTPEEERFYEEARSVVEAHIGDRAFDVGMFVSEMGRVVQNKSQLRRKLKAATGFAPGEFIRHMRLERAAHLLEQDESLYVYEVADAVGYSDADYFSRRFREQFGVSPSQYPSAEE